MKKLSLSCLAGAVLLIVSVSLSLAVSVHASARMPEFVLKNVVDGAEVDSRSFSGKVLLVSFFATWCPPCIEEIPTFIELQTSYADEGFSVVALSVDQGGPEAVATLVGKKKINYPVLMADEETMEKFGGVYGIPVSFLVNMEGNVVKKYPGYVPKSILQKDIQSMLN
ncbi:TlpA disulfide reductase family protein [Desulfopila aestuarii]|uniref:Thiol-disulfide isomerase or thioredoxin n=1 Tax=Desulfopila aestuarii DSM 18488 TaxID=1121416 RepID=A0A1M7YAX8_9BACT|nr:TlpA disulfide reductase family protein [Desulfopila aestuarii]SHO49716.1 Thiol-disulfide isomerase or thioredoxin [Desulfopila aestuarii DSM 18488]